MKQSGLIVVLGVGALLAVGYWAWWAGEGTGFANPSVAGSAATEACLADCMGETGLTDPPSIGPVNTAPASEPAQPTVPEQPILPGAMVVIEAARYPSLQAAFDALPEQGGLVRLPLVDFPFTPL